MNKENDIKLMDLAKELSFEYMRDADGMRAFPDEASLNDLAHFDEPLPTSGTPATDVLELMNKYGAPASVGMTCGRYYGFVNGNVLPIAQAAEWIIDTWNQNTALYAMSPITSKLEDITEKWLVDLFGFPKDTAMGVVTGSSNALICALAAARNFLLAKQGYDITAKGFRGAPKVRIVMSEDIHSAAKASLSILGFGTDEAELVPCDEYGRMILSKMPELDANTLVLCQAGNVNGGAFDPIGEISDIAHEKGAWVHVDGAFGLWAAVSKRQKANVSGLEKADSWSCDAHKTLNSGYDCGLLFCTRRDALVQALQAGAPYLPASSNRDGMNYTTEMSRRAHGIILWAIIKNLGADGIEKLIDNMCDNAVYFADKLTEAGIPPVNPPFFNQLMFRFDTDEKTNAVLAEIQKSGTTWCGGSLWKGKNVIRISISSYSTTHEDIDKSVAAITDAAMRFA